MEAIPVIGAPCSPSSNTLRFHDLRHTAATLMLSRGIHPKVASEMLGHSTIAITLDLYSHVSKTMQQEAARSVDAALGLE